MNRRFFTAMGLSSMLPYLNASNNVSEKKTKRFICLANPFGMHKESFWPKSFGKDFEITKTLEPLKALKNDFSLFSNMTHGVRGGHIAQAAVLTTLLPSQAQAYKEGMQSLDQKIAEFNRSKTRFPSLVLGLHKPSGFRSSLSWTRTGTLIPTIYSPNKLFNLLFAQPVKGEVSKSEFKLKSKKSIIDGLLTEVNTLNRKLSINDQDKIEQSLGSIREVEKELHLQEKWLKKDIPKVDLSTVHDNQNIDVNLKNTADLAFLALKTDQTRVVTIDCDMNYHGLSHHGKLEDKIKELVKIETIQMKALASIITKLKYSKDPLNEGDNMLENTVVLFASGLGNGNSHSNEDLPIILAGGGFKHGRHIKENVKLGHLFVSILESVGVDSTFKNFNTPFPGY